MIKQRGMMIESERAHQKRKQRRRIEKKKKGSLSARHHHSTILHQPPENVDRQTTERRAPFSMSLLKYITKNSAEKGQKNGKERGVRRHVRVVHQIEHTHCLTRYVLSL